MEQAITMVGRSVGQGDWRSCNGRVDTRKQEQQHNIVSRLLEAGCVLLQRSKHTLMEDGKPILLCTSCTSSRGRWPSVVANALCEDWYIRVVIQVSQ
jgi:hypothetical protein